MSFFDYITSAQESLRQGLETVGNTVLGFIPGGSNFTTDAASSLDSIVSPTPTPLATITNTVYKTVSPSAPVLPTADNMSTPVPLFSGVDSQTATSSYMPSATTTAYGAGAAAAAALVYGLNRLRNRNNTPATTEAPTTIKVEGLSDEMTAALTEAGLNEEAQNVHPFEAQMLNNIGAKFIKDALISSSNKESNKKAFGQAFSYFAEAKIAMFAKWAVFADKSEPTSENIAAKVKEFLADKEAVQQYEEALGITLDQTKIDSKVSQYSTDVKSVAKLS